MKKGLADLVSFAVAFIIIAIVALIVQVAGIVVHVEPEFDYAIEEVTRFQSCDITLLNLLQSPIEDGSSTDFAEAIALERAGKLPDFDVKDKAEALISQIYTKGDVEFDYAGSCLGSRVCADSGVCCSQIIPGLDGKCVEVKLFETE